MRYGCQTRTFLRFHPTRATWFRDWGWLLLLLCALVLAPVNRAAADAPELAPAGSERVPERPSGICTDGTQASGAKYRICMPASPPHGLEPAWNHDLVVYAHGYVSPLAPIAIPEDQLVLGGISLPLIVNSQGFAFATTSYRANGLVALEALQDLEDLVRIFKSEHPDTYRVWLTGVSEGGLITTLAIERSNTFAGGLAVCGPIGDFQKQVDYFTDFRVVWDYFFPGTIPGSAVNIPAEVVTTTWDTQFFPQQILPILNDPGQAISVTQLFSVTQAAVVPAPPIERTATISNTVHKALWYNALATNNASVKLGGNPYSNTMRLYSGSLDDTRLNAMVVRFTADPAATDAIAAYQTTGQPRAPLVTLHTTLDEQVPYWHEALYRAKIVANHKEAMHRDIRIDRYGHCNLTLEEARDALNAMMHMRTYLPLLEGRQP